SASAWNLAQTISGGNSAAILPGAAAWLWHRPSSFLHLRQRRLGLEQPEGHVHGQVQRNSRGQLSTGLLPLVCLDVQCTETTVAVRLERAHPEFLGQRYGLAVVDFSR